MATLQWIDTPAGLRLLWTAAGKVAMSHDCCCTEVAQCGGCLDGVPVELALVWTQFRDVGPYTPPLLSNCSAMNVAPAILEYAIPRPPSVFGDEPTQKFYVDGQVPCVYRYYYGSPLTIEIEGSSDAPSSSVIGWGAELITFDSQPRVVVYPVGGDDKPWGYDAVEAPYGEVHWVAGQNDPHDCGSGWTASVAGGFNGNFVLGGGVIISRGNDYGCLFDGTKTISIQPV